MAKSKALIKAEGKLKQLQKAVKDMEKRVKLLAAKDAKAGAALKKKVTKKKTTGAKKTAGTKKTAKKKVGTKSKSSVKKVTVKKKRAKKSSPVAMPGMSINE